MTRKTNQFAVLAAAVLLAFALAGTAQAADVAKIVEGCALCHGKDGASTEPDVPIIAGQSADYLSSTMESYKKKERTCPETKYKSGTKKGTKTDMCQIVKELSASDMTELGNYFAKKKFVRAVQKTNPALVAKGKRLHDDYCEKCHSEGGSSPKDDAGILAGQWMGYLDEQMKEFFAGHRVPTKKMKVQLDKLDKTAIDPLVNYYGSQK